ncbi:bifunctional 3,4-dihydroxy-2-butanone-4-phosphate synthase/GTP cyclohydrolase II [Gordonia rubripertincta]|uniref:Riboflavin biosynthesis protein RibBA n=1 Tax=Gordonia rubripertincta TaxID=36822 RepID=A0ABT4MNQ0_GORRU|nr:bifunctional 3,4-dihydroxy-2-butanone-4-phosphate synthase/GTP cyclohydrolase II [Gordonia rubripertincta]MCZ4548627.1 bifunctional 3,4-dihydroxy-2-butanone-4-phosphate synthase/GTP cyclohydrolase II [Gordonia rubripertincta]
MRKPATPQPFPNPDPDRSSRFDDVQDAIDAVAAGRPVVVVDDEDRENEGDLILAAEHATTENMAFLVRYTSGFICVAMTDERADELDLPLMVSEQNNGESLRTAFAVSVDAGTSVTTGISAKDRATTARALADARTTPDGLTRPGHVMPLRARDGGVLVRAGHTEATVDLCSLAGCAPVGVLCELVDDDGEMSRRPSLFAFARRHDLPIISVRELIAYRRRNEPQVSRVSAAQIPTMDGEFTGHVFVDRDGVEHLALVIGSPHLAASTSDAAPLVRLHSECMTGDVLGSLRCDCGPQLQDSLRAIAYEGRGVLVYVRGHEGRGVGLGAKIAAYALQEQGRDTVDANLDLGLPVDARQYWQAAAILRDLGVDRIRLITNNPDKTAALEEHGITVVERVARPAHVNQHNRAYLRTKELRMGHEIGADPQARFAM